MTRSGIDDHAARAQRQSTVPGDPVPVWYRAQLLLFGLILAALALWVLLPESYRARNIELPTNEPASRLLLAKRDSAARAASLAALRGDLWAESALTYSNLLWGAGTTGAGAAQTTAAKAREDLENALRYSPHRSDVWLMLAELAERNHWQNYAPTLLLRMSYYTAPNELALFALRVKTSLRAGMIDDPEIQDMSKHDIRQVVTKAPTLRPALVEAYKQASPAGKAFVERVISEIDPTYLALLRAGML
ncbi:hypothetical protein ASC80_02225 [Afipia sp. Root123D2]|uniref:hypothetical protein n=1 Tax=Afipia sp. Root123D2 TaxID=1736436 RepID=UPI0006F45354|nr:hypothetical protein [Afipia sp. Root123D2]KQW22232.1 hypothetical protein ASC80_02225 [Afipia sp. Root123D2]